MIYLSYAFVLKQLHFFVYLFVSFFLPLFLSTALVMLQWCCPPSLFLSVPLPSTEPRNLQLILQVL